jgi:hypothetical protein
MRQFTTPRGWRDQSIEKDLVTFTATPPDLPYEQARRRAIRLRGFYIHSLAFVLGNTANFIVNVITRQNAGDWWFQWVLILWSIALGVHALTLVGQGAWFGPTGRNARFAGTSQQRLPGYAGLAADCYP